MRAVLSTGLVLVVLASAACLNAATATNGDEYRQALTDYFQVADGVIADLLENDLTDSDLAVIFHIAERSGQSPYGIAKLRVKGYNWLKVAKSRGLGPRDFFVLVVGQNTSETFAPIFAKFKMTPIQQWHKLELTDSDITNLVNLKFISSHHDYSIFKAMALCDAGQDFVQVNHQVRLRKAELIRADLLKKKAALTAQSN